MDSLVAVIQRPIELPPEHPGWSHFQQALHFRTRHYREKYGVHQVPVDQWDFVATHVVSYAEGFTEPIMAWRLLTHRAAEQYRLTFPVHTYASQQPMLFSHLGHHLEVARQQKGTVGYISRLALSLEAARLHPHPGAMKLLLASQVFQLFQRKQVRSSYVSAAVSLRLSRLYVQSGYRPIADQQGPIQIKSPAVVGETTHLYHQETFAPWVSELAAHPDWAWTDQNLTWLGGETQKHPRMALI